ncbi:hypothetical protein BD311DRAFT_411773 [Dichomitus squalens]|uniref:Uncharacterized protein n=1 Tax=Dichomitus squalens TaxID=114155 RepID=A0A4Q9MHX6_9APHY|nr:hypothetical protein BD311DRAFT_411773 [Dichomitus squalens]
MRFYHAARWEMVKVAAENRQQKRKCGASLGGVATVRWTHSDSRAGSSKEFSAQEWRGQIGEQTYRNRQKRRGPPMRPTIAIPGRTRAKSNPCSSSKQSRGQSAHDAKL